MSDSPKRHVSENKLKLLKDKELSYNTIFDSVHLRKNCFFFLYAPGGLGNIFVRKLHIAKIRQKKGSVLAVPKSEIAATLLPFGSIAHSDFTLTITLLCLIQQPATSARFRLN